MGRGVAMAATNAGNCRQANDEPITARDQSDHLLQPHMRPITLQHCIMKAMQQREESLGQPPYPLPPSSAPRGSRGHHSSYPPSHSSNFSTNERTRGNGNHAGGCDDESEQFLRGLQSWQQRQGKPIPHLRATSCASGGNLGQESGKSSYPPPPSPANKRVRGNGNKGGGCGNKTKQQL